MANNRDTFCVFTSTAVKTTINISRAPPGTEGIDIEHVVAVITVITIDAKSSVIPFKRAMKIVEMVRKMAVPLLLSVTPSERTNLEILSSHFTLFIMHSVATGNDIALKIKHLHFTLMIDA